MNSTMPIPVGIFIGCLALAVFYWFYLCATLFSYLSKKHPDTYREMGSPSLIMNNTPRNNMSFLSFILRNKYSAISDDFLNKRCKFMKYYFYLYGVFMGGLTIAIISLGKSS
jgi:hypothetical protein